MKKLLFTCITIFTIVFCINLSGKEIVINPQKAVIVADKVNQKAARELKLHLEWITGQVIPIEKQSKNGMYSFFVGKNPAEDKVKFQPEEARWKITLNGAYFYGDKNNGALFAVYDFLENELNIRWPSIYDIAGKKQNPIKISSFEGKWIPSLNIRIIRPGSGKQLHLQWRRRLRMGGHDQPVYGHAFTKYWQRFGKTHPEYFAMRKDKVRAPIGAKGNSNNIAAFRGPQAEAIAMCVSNENFINQIIADWKKQGCPLYINLCENDALGKDSCHCSNCKALDAVVPQNSQWENCFADRYVNFANKVLEKAKKIRPDVKVSMYAYNATEQPPKKEVPHKDFVIGIVPTDFTINGIKSYVTSWKKAGLNNFFYRPNRHHYYNLSQIPMGYEKHFFDILQFLCKSGAIGFDYDAYTDVSAYDFFSNYILLKAMQDPDKTFEYWEDHYMQAFGAAKDDVKNYYAYWRNEVWNKRLVPKQAEIATQGKVFNFARGLAWTLGKYYTDNDFVVAGKFLTTALTKKLTVEEIKLVKKLQLENEHSRLVFNAIAKKTDADSINLLNFRKKHNYPLLPWNEQYYGDICGIKRVMNFAAYKIPFIKTDLFWHFRLDPQDVGVTEKWFNDIPSKLKSWSVMCTNTPWENPHKHYKHIPDALRKQTASYNGIAWYGLQLKVPADWKNRKVYLYFEAVDESCWLYVNGKLAATRLYKNPNDWSTPFALEITPFVNFNQKIQNIVVRVQDTNGQGGIWKPVWLVSK